MKTFRPFDALSRRSGRFAALRRELAEEVAVAISYNGSAHAVLMATPGDLADLACGFSLSEGIVDACNEIENVEVAETPLGIDLRVWLKKDAAEALAERRRSMAGPVGCGLCGIESLEQAMRRIEPVTASVVLEPEAVAEAVAAMAEGQDLNARTRAVHAAGFFRPGEGMVALREDVGRHNALDKLIGAAMRDDFDMTEGVIVVTSRLSVELIQKCARAGSCMLIAVSAPTALAVESARAANITLVAVARGGEFEIFSHPERIAGGVLSDVA